MVLTLTNLLELEERAREALEPASYDYIAGGAEDEASLRRNRGAFDRWALRPRVLVDVSQRDLTTTVLGTEVSLPVLVAPTAFHRLVHEDGEAATARGAQAAGTLMVLSTLSTCPLEDVAAVGNGPRWFQLYVYRDRAVTEDLVARAEGAGYRALCVTVDTPLGGRRERDERNAFTLPEGVTLGHFTDGEPRTLPGAEAGTSGLATYWSAMLDPSLTWDVVDWLRERTSLPLVLKGIMTREDATRAVQAGVEGVVVSNHGGRQLDHTLGTLDALPEVVEAVAGRTEVYVDGGVRRGTDVLKALALGARAVLVGRPLLWALALGGAEGVQAALEHLRRELDVALALVGCPRVADVRHELVQQVSP